MPAKAFILQIIDSDIQDRLIFLGRTCSDAYQEIGNMTVTICTRLDELKVMAMQGQYLPPDALKLAECGYMDCYRAVAELVGKSTRTIRYYAQVCRFYDAETWARYDVLPFSHFEFAMSLGSRWMDVLDAALERMDNNNGRPPSVDWLEANFSGVCQVQNDINRIEAQDEVERVYESVVAEADTMPPQPDDRGRSAYALSVIARVLQPLERYLDTVELPPTVARALTALFDALRDALEIQVKI